MAGALPQACRAQIWGAVLLSRRCQDQAESPESGEDKDQHPEVWAVEVPGMAGYSVHSDP